VLPVNEGSDPERLLSGVGSRGLIPRGLGRSYGDAAMNAGGQVLDMTASPGMGLDVATGRATVASGTSLDAVIRAALPSGWFVPVTPGTRSVTVGGAIAADVHGKNHHREGGFCDFVESFELLSPGAGRLTVTREAMPEVFDATAGGMGLTGVILEATLRLIPVESAWMRVDIERASDLDDLMARMDSGDGGYRYSVAWVDCLANGRHLGRGVLTRGEHAAADELGRSERGRGALSFRPRTPIPMPPGVPSSLLRPITARAFNEFWFRKAPSMERGRLNPLASFFHPLDGVKDWNHLYGPQGFVQYQLAVPPEGHEIVRAVVDQLSIAGIPSFLGVLKRFGPGRGMLSFPIAGWTLALDIPASVPGLAEILDGFDDLVAEAGGRIYLAKDARLRSELLPRMYPELGRWREVRERLDPERMMRSDLARRLGL
jgi:decaprenylphospho-beta-D-ribofuranose 2-oxidase